MRISFSNSNLIVLSRFRSPAQQKETVEKLEQTRLLLEKDRDAERLKLREAEENAKKSAQLRAELEVRLEKADLKSRREAERILQDARETAEQVFAELDEMKKRLNEEDDVSRINEARNAAPLLYFGYRMQCNGGLS